MSRLAEDSNGPPLRLALESGFQIVDDHFDGTVPIRRLFSIARLQEAASVLIEDVPPAGAVDAENLELAALYPDYECVGVRRVSFWRSPSPATDDSAVPVGCAILKRDRAPSSGLPDRWHVFEAVMAPWETRFHCHPASHGYDFVAAGSGHSVRGFLYCQQNGLNKVCAQVALRSLCAPYLGNLDLTYAEINRAGSKGVEAGLEFHPARPWETPMIKAVLGELEIEFTAIDYDGGHDRWNEFPYQHLVYSGVEAGCGALLAFSYEKQRTAAGPSRERVGHVIPCFGHTLNPDAWAPHADMAYFGLERSAFRRLPPA